MKMAVHLFVAKLGSVLLFISLPVFAAAQEPRTETQTAGLAAANVVGVKGEVLSAQSRWRAGPQKLIVTDVTVRVDQASQPDMAETVTFTVPGGELPNENLRMTVSAVPIFRKGQSVALSLSPPRPDTLGKFVYRVAPTAEASER